ncbi:helix-turn-helix transcriptional regulator [Alkalihalobacillus pseudalcaliphilus]|uniref:helix-turn-helix transcriptional regulator n=1 Tax=Alkalihalobacillus pseudalcaliphilus TaxID=79884 RepID=UPI00064DC2EF|nr:helix-turn-helix transcriptional regulator [Alkalihalobacillus pseudalcaliphilus]KMK78090.1 hypothetical protein AB990_01165 [Alkalihalobacillus pseudalcaliphilus]
MEQDISYTVEEVANLLKVSKLTVYDLLKKGTLPSFKVGRQMRIQAKDLQLFINGKQSNNHLPQKESNQQMHVQNQTQTKRRVVISGQDLVLDMLGKQLDKLGSFVSLRSNEGSLNGLISMYKDECDIVSLHMFDAETGTYNLPYVNRILVGHSYMVLNLLSRNAGLMVSKSNPLHLQNWTDLQGNNIRFINREVGSGARILLEEQLKLYHIQPSQVHGYHHVESSHLAVASAIAAGKADVGVGIEKVAKLVDLEFIPLIKERYDIVIRKTLENEVLLQQIQKIVTNPDFIKEIQSLGNYDTSLTGEVIFETE